MGGDVQRGASSAAGEVRQQLQIRLLGDPRRSGLEVVQKYLRHHVLRQQQRVPFGEDVLLQIPQRAAVLTGHRLHHPQRPFVAGVQPLQQQHRRHPHGQLLPPGQGGGEAHHLPRPPRTVRLVRQRAGGVQQLERRVVVQRLRAAVVGEHRREEPLLPAGAVTQQGAYGEFQRIADPPPVLGHQLVVGVEDLIQIQPPLLHVGDGAGVGAAVLRTLLGVPGVEPGDDLAQQSRRLPADVALPVHEQLV